ncbi:MAG: hypothetical protein ACR2QM_13505, partial [Longimicrobiales bacterium]
MAPPVVFRSTIQLGVQCALLFATPVFAQDAVQEVGPDAHRIWATVHTESGDRHEGFIRWDRNEGSWVDLLDGRKGMSEEAYDIWREAWQAEQPVRTVELLGYRISWDEVDPDFPLEVQSAIRFGHLAELIPTGSSVADLVLRSGEEVEYSGQSTDIGRWRELTVRNGGRETELVWQDVERIVFGPVPEGTLASSPRLYGTVEDRRGRTFTGFVSWDLDEIFGDDVLDGEDEDGKDWDVKFSDIQSIERTLRGSRVTLGSGDVLELSGTNDVEDGNRGIQISDPALGMVEVEWDDFEVLDFQAAKRSPGYSDFTESRRLTGTVVTQSGDEIQGRIRWDADEEWSWEFLDGTSEGVGFKIEFGQISRIERGEAFGADVTLVDGRSYTLEDSNDVSWDNKGIFVQVQEP